MTEAEKRAKARYQRKLKIVRIEFYPSTEADIIEHLEFLRSAGVPIASYIKSLISRDMYNLL